MSNTFLIDQSIIALILVAKLAAPSVIVGTLSGLLIGLFQSLTQIQEQTLPLAIKIITVGIVCLWTMHWIGGMLFRYAETLFRAIENV